MTKPLWAPLVYGRTYEVDFRFIAVPDNFGAKDLEKAENYIRVTTRSAEKLPDNPRWLLLKNKRFCIVGVTCMVRELVGAANEKTDDLTELTKDSHGRPLYVFVGYVAEKSPDTSILEFPPMKLKFFTRLYEYVRLRWLEKSYDLSQQEAEVKRRFSYQEDLEIERDDLPSPKNTVFRGESNVVEEETTVSDATTVVAEEKQISETVSSSESEASTSKANQKAPAPDVNQSDVAQGKDKLGSQLPKSIVSTGEANVIEKETTVSDAKNVVSEVKPISETVPSSESEASTSEVNQEAPAPDVNQSDVSQGVEKLGSQLEPSSSDQILHRDLNSPDRDIDFVYLWSVKENQQLWNAAIESDRRFSVCLNLASEKELINSPFLNGTAQDVTFHKKVEKLRPQTSSVDAQQSKRLVTQESSSGDGWRDVERELGALEVDISENRSTEPMTVLLSQVREFIEGSSKFLIENLGDVLSGRADRRVRQELDKARSQIKTIRAELNSEDLGERKRKLAVRAFKRALREWKEANYHFKWKNYREVVEHLKTTNLFIEETAIILKQRQIDFKFKPEDSKTDDSLWEM